MNQSDRTDRRPANKQTVLSVTVLMCGMPRYHYTICKMQTDVFFFTPGWSSFTSTVKTCPSLSRKRVPGSPKKRSLTKCKSTAPFPCIYIVYSNTSENCSEDVVCVSGFFIRVAISPELFCWNAARRLIPKWQKKQHFRMVKFVVAFFPTWILDSVMIYTKVLYKMHIFSYALLIEIIYLSNLLK